MSDSIPPLSAYPLLWPLGRPRTSAGARKSALFGTKTIGGPRIATTRKLSIEEGCRRLQNTIERLHASSLVISTNLQLRRDGLPRSGQPEPIDPGAAAYFNIFVALKSHSYVVACDKWDRVADNLAAIAAHLEAMRGQDRWGCGSREQAFTGYKALTAADAVKLWWNVLGFDKPPDQWQHVEEKHAALARKHHPDLGGDAGTMAAINAARDDARRFYENREDDT